MKVTGAGKPLLLLHSSLSSHRQWQGLTYRLKDEFQCFQPDLLGYGQSELPSKHPWTLADEADAIISQLSSVLSQGDPFSVVGHSYGGVVALHLARTGKIPIDNLVLFEPVAFHLLREHAKDHEVLQQIFDFSVQLANCSPQEAAESFINYWQGEGAFARLLKPSQELIVSQVAKIPLDFSALLNEPATLDDYAQAISYPTLLLVGQESRKSALEIAQLLATALPNLQMQHLAVGHMGPITHPTIVEPIIVEFLRQHL